MRERGTASQHERLEKADAGADQPDQIRKATQVGVLRTANT
jgi:hypothetical protein